MLSVYTIYYMLGTEPSSYGKFHFSPFAMVCVEFVVCRETHSSEGECMNSLLNIDSLIYIFWPMNAEQNNSKKLKYFVFRLQYLQPRQIVWVGKYVGRWYINWYISGMLHQRQCRFLTTTKIIINCLDYVCISILIFFFSYSYKYTYMC